MKHIIKRERHKELFDKSKLTHSIEKAALNCHYEEEDALAFAKSVTKEVVKWIKDKPIIESKELKKVAHENMHDHEVAMMYQDHGDMS